MNKKAGMLIALALMILSTAAFAPQAFASRPMRAEQLPWNSGALRAVPVQSALSDSRAYAIATEALIAYFRDEFIKTQLFIDTYGEVAWDEISGEVTDSVDIVRDRKMEKETYDDKQFAFTGLIYDSYAEIVVDKTTGEVKKVIIELL